MQNKGQCTVSESNREAAMETRDAEGAPDNCTRPALENLDESIRRSLSTINLHPATVRLPTTAP
jgi:hypothetical protein